MVLIFFHQCHSLVLIVVLYFYSGCNVGIARTSCQVLGSFCRSELTLFIKIRIIRKAVKHFSTVFLCRYNKLKLTFNENNRSICSVELADPGHVDIQ